MRDIDPKRLHELETRARYIGQVIGSALPPGAGFALMVFSFAGPELTWISNADRADMVKILDEFRAKLAADTADELSRPKGSG